MILRRISDSEFVAQFSSLARTLNLRYLPNLLLVILLPIVAIAGVAVAFAYDTNPSPVLENSVSMALTQGFWSVVGFFMTWVLAREIDPDYDFSAFLGGFLFLPILWVLPAVQVASIEEVTSFGLLSMVVLILSVRVVDRLVGPKPRWIDSLLVLALAALLLPFDNWMMVLVPIAALVLDVVLHPRLIRHALFAVVLVVLFVGRFAQVGLLTLEGVRIDRLILVFAVGLLYVGTIAATTQVRKGTDVAGYEVSLTRVRAGMGLVLFAALLMFLWRGDLGLQALLPAWAAIIGVTLFRLPITLFRLSRNTPDSLADKIDEAEAASMTNQAEPSDTETTDETTEDSAKSEATATDSEDAAEQPEEDANTTDEATGDEPDEPPTR